MNTIRSPYRVLESASTMTTRMRRVVAVIAVLSLATAITARAAIYTWTNASSGNWTSTTAWTPSGSYPDSTDGSDSALLSITGSDYTVSFPIFGTVTLGSLNIMSPNAKLYLQSVYGDNVPPATTITSLGSVANAGTIDLYGNGVGFWADGDVFFNVTSGAINNTGTLKARTDNIYGYGPQVQISSDINNEAGGIITMAQGAGGGAIRLTKSGGAYVNQGSWTVTGSAVVNGQGTSFLQNVAGASLNAASGSWTMGATSDTVNSTFSITGGSIGGSFLFSKTDVTLGAGGTINASTIELRQANLTLNSSRVNGGAVTYRFNGNETSSAAVGGGTLTLSALNASETLEVTEWHQSWNTRTLVTSTAFDNYGTVKVYNQNFNTDQGFSTDLEIGSGALTNRGTLTVTGSASYPNSPVRMLGTLVNTADGTVNLQGSGQARIGTAGATHTNNGVINVVFGTGNYIDGTSLTNDTGGVIRNSGTSVTLGGTATIDNALGTIQAVEGAGSSTFTISNLLSAGTKSGTVLAGGTWRVQSAANATALSVTNGSSWNITQLGTDTIGGTPTSVILDGANASFTQLESGSLTKIGLNGKLTLLNGKTLSSFSGPLTVAGQLAGTGTVGGAVTVAGIDASNRGRITPGNSIDTLNVNGNVTFGNFSSLVAECDNAGNADLLAVTGTVDLTSTGDRLEILTLNGGLIGPYTLVTSTGGISGFFNEVYYNGVLQPSATAMGGIDGKFGLIYSSNSLILIPEPATLALLALAGAALASRRRR